MKKIKFLLSIFFVFGVLSIFSQSIVVSSDIYNVPILTCKKYNPALKICLKNLGNLNTNIKKINLSLVGTDDIDIIRI